MTSHVEVTSAQFDMMIVGKSYAFNGRVGRVIAKSEPSNVSAVKIVVGMPTVTVRWRS